MYKPADLPLTVQRHAPFPEDDPWTLTEPLTGVPVPLTGWTLTMEVRLYDDAPGLPLLTPTLTIVNALAGQFLPAVTEAAHEALPPAPVTACGTADLKLRHAIKGQPPVGVARILARGDYTVQGSAVS